MLFFQLVFVVIIVFLILRRPYLGVVFTAASLPVIDLLPAVPGFSSVVPLFGATAILGILGQRKKEHKPLFRFGNVHILGLLFIGWIFLSNPKAAWFNYDRSWLFTFFQLWVLLWLAGELLDTPQKHHVFMWIYSIVTVASALVAIQQGSIGENVDASSRALGLAEGANSAARYFVVAMIFLNYLRTVEKGGFPRFFAALGTIITFFGVFFTVSRTGILLIFVALGMTFFLNTNSKYRVQLIIIFAFSVLGLWYLSDNIVSIVRSIIPSIVEGTDTAGLRYALWQAGWRMWLHNPLRGVGIGMYPRQLRYFGQDLMAPLYLKGAVAHNTYVQILAETGLIGFVIFLLLLIKSLQNILRADMAGNENSTVLRNVWLIVLVAMLLGGLTKTDYADKMIWLVIGVSVYFKDQVREGREGSLPDNESKVFSRRPVPSYARKPAGRSLEFEEKARSDASKI